MLSVHMGVFVVEGYDEDEDEDEDFAQGSDLEDWVDAALDYEEA